MKKDKCTKGTLKEGICRLKCSKKWSFKDILGMALAEETNTNLLVSL